MNPTGARRDAEDQRFLDAFDSGALSPRDFHHREHLRLAWLCVIQSGTEAAMEEFPRRLRAFLARHRVDPAKYHETVTIGWLRLVGARVSTEPAAPSHSQASRHLSCAETISALHPATPPTQFVTYYITNCSDPVKD